METRNSDLEDLKNCAHYEETMWRQIKEGDRNTKFFQRLANSHRRNNSVIKLRIEGNWLLGEDNLNQGIVKAFQSLMSDHGEWRTSLEGLSFSKLNACETNDLEKAFFRIRGDFCLERVKWRRSPQGRMVFIGFVWKSCWKTC